MTSEALFVLRTCILAVIVNWFIILGDFYSTVRYALQIFIHSVCHISRIWSVRQKTKSESEGLPAQTSSAINGKQRRKVADTAEGKGETSNNAQVPKHRLHVHKNVDEKLSLEEIRGLVEEVVTLCEDEVEEISENFSEEDVREAFDVFDEDNDGFIDAQEVKKVVHALCFMEASDVECSSMIKAFDKNGDGLIDFNEFVKLLAKS